MKPIIACCLLLISYVSVSAQKKLLDHSVYNSWQHIGERMISNDGKWVVYTIDPQQGDNELVIQSADAKYKKVIPRGYAALITEDSRYVIFKIKPFFSDTRQAKIKKKKADDMPKDSLAIVELGKEEVWKTARVKSYKTPQKSFGWVAYHSEKKIEPSSKAKSGDNANKINDSLKHIIDSLQIIIESAPKKKRNRDGEETDESFEDAEGDETSGPAADAGTNLVVRNLSSGEEKVFANVTDYYFSKKDDKLLIRKAKNAKDTTSSTGVILYDLKNAGIISLSNGGNDFKNFTMTDDASQIAYVAERDARPNDLQKFYRIWYYKNGMDSAALLIDKNSVDMKVGTTVSEFAPMNFSKNGKRLFFGTAEIQAPKDTNLVEFENAKLDIWHYNDDYLQTVQTNPNRLRNDVQQSYLAVYDLENKALKQLGSKELPQVIQTNEGDGDTFVGITDVGKRIESQWLGQTRKDIYAIDVNTGNKTLVKENLHGQVYPSTKGKYIMWYDRKAKNYFTWDGDSTRNITAKIKVPLYEEDWDTPDDAANYGVMGWHEGDSAVYVYDRYDVWKAGSVGNRIERITPIGRELNDRYRYLKLDSDEKYIKHNQDLFLNRFNQVTKESSLLIFNPQKGAVSLFYITGGKFGFGNVSKAKESGKIIYTKESFNEAPDIFSNDDELEVEGFDSKAKRIEHEAKLSSINPQQKDYNWGTAELFKWKAYTGKESAGIVYKPEDFDPAKKYPMIVYFYEKLSDGLYSYKEPAPIRSAVNVPFFVSRGYIIFMPDIEYKTGYPGQGAYDYIISGTKALIKKGFIDSSNMALQGHSWGGYQAAQLATMTKLFKAVWAGAPVANMTSAYGGIRWESGVNRQFQYEKTQSRIGATLWQKPDLYIKNSPLFQLDKVTAPMVIMANDADGAVPWYQGIEMFTALRRLGKKVWMFNYNGQGHGLTQRQDMLDYQIRMQQFFDWILKGDKPAKWITEGVPAIKKGKDWGLEVE
jgi:dipeptidyl aminopeptidase/acylaminoacyl peptidase